MAKDYIKKIPTFIAFLKLLLVHIRVEIMLKFMVFFGSFLDAPVAHPLIDTLIFLKVPLPRKIVHLKKLIETCLL